MKLKCRSCRTSIPRKRRGDYNNRSVWWQKLSPLQFLEWGPSFFQQAMLRNHCRETMRFLHFDLRSTRPACLQTDKFALVSDIWNRFVGNSMSCYKPGKNIMIDEQLFPTKSLCRFTKYMPNKPDKFDIEFWLAVKVESKYIPNATNPSIS